MAIKHKLHLVVIVRVNSTYKILYFSLYDCNQFQSFNYYQKVRYQLITRFLVRNRENIFNALLFWVDPHLSDIILEIMNVWCISLQEMHRSQPGINKNWSSTWNEPMPGKYKILSMILKIYRLSFPGHQWLRNQMRFDHFFSTSLSKSMRKSTNLIWRRFFRYQTRYYLWL